MGFVLSTWAFGWLAREGWSILDHVSDGRQGVGLVWSGFGEIVFIHLWYIDLQLFI